MRARRHRRVRPRGHAAPAAGIEPAISRVTTARLPDSTTPERKAEAAGLEPADGVSRLRVSNAPPCRLGHASRGGRRGSRTPKVVRPTRFRDGIPHQRGSPSSAKRSSAKRTCGGVWGTGRFPSALRFEVTPAGIEPALPRVRAGSSPLSYGVKAWPAGIEPATPRVSGGRSTGLSYGHIDEWARVESNQPPLVCKTSALAGLSYSPSRWAGLESNQRPLPYQRSALPPELPALNGRTGKAGTAS